MKKTINIIIAILLVIVSCGLGYFYFELQDRIDIIVKLEKKLEKKEEKINSLTEEIEEKNYIIETYESSTDKELVNDNTSSSNTEYSNITKIDFNKMQEMIDNKETFVIVATMTSCSHCISYKPVFNDVLKKNNIKGYEIDLQEQESSIRNTFNNKYDVSGTPTTLFFINGEENKDSRIVGNQSKEQIITSLKENHFISE